MNDLAAQLSVRDLHTDENSPADLALQAASRVKSQSKVSHRRSSVSSLISGKTTSPNQQEQDVAESGPTTQSTTPEGTQISENHAQYALSYGMMLGIRVTQGRRQISDAPDHHDPTDADFDVINKLKFPPEGSNHPPNITPPHRLAHAFKFKDYAPNVFRKIRQHFGVNEADYMLSLCGDFNFIEFVANSKSGQFFFYSHDGRYMIKTQTKAEGKFLRSLLPSYYAHLKANPSSLMTRFYGMHRVEMKHLNRKMRFIIMSSVFYTPLPVHRMFDLKGSSVGRSATREERERPNVVMKDNDLEMDAVTVNLGPRRGVFLENLRSDSEWLAGHNIMDYSLLLGIHQGEQRKEGMRTVSVQLTEGEVVRQSRLHGDAAAAGADGIRIRSATEVRNSGTAAERLIPGQRRASAAYSTLDNNQSVFNADSGGVYERSPSGAKGADVYFLGIIDILQQYNAKKAAENFFKGFKYDRREISAVHPKLYAERFVEYMSKNSK